MKVLVTGGAGYVGSHACKELSREGYTPVVYDNLVHGHREAVRWGPFEEGDLADTPRLVRLIREHRIEAVLHFAAFAYVGESIRKPGIYYRNNVGGSLSLLEALVETQVKKLIFSSTCAIYGLPERVPMDESHSQNPINPYGQTKRVVELMLSDFRVAHGFDSICLRYFNAAGADPEGETGELHDPETHLIPLALRATQGKGSEFVVFGQDYSTRDGTCIRDYIHVTDLARAHVLALGKLVSGQGFSPAYNLGNGQGFSVFDVIHSVEKVTGRKVHYRIGDRRLGDPPQLIADSARARKELGWLPKYPELDRIVETAWKFFKPDSGRAC